MKRHWYRILIGGLILYLASAFSIALTCFDVSDPTFSICLSAAFIFGTLTTVFLLIYRRTTLVRQILSGFVLQLEFWLLFLLDSFFGITRSIVPFSEDNYAGGLVGVCFWLSFSVVSVIAVLCDAIVRGIIKICRR